MIINGKAVSLSSLSLSQLYRIDDALEAVFFKESHLFIDTGEKFAPSYMKDKKHFKEIISCMISFKRDMMAYFSSQYANRYSLIRHGVILDEGDISDDEDMDSEYLYPTEWEKQDKELAALIEEHTKKAYELGIVVLILLGLLAIHHTSDDAKAQKLLLKNAFEVASQINNVTKKRIIAQIKTSLQLNETREQFEGRLKKVLVNPYRGRFIAQDQALRSYLDGKKNAANEAGYTKKQWIGVQTDKNEICGSVMNDIVDIDANFKNGFNGPLAHLGCKCDLLYS